MFVFEVGFAVKENPRNSLDLMEKSKKKKKKKIRLDPFSLINRFTYCGPKEGVVSALMHISHASDTLMLEGRGAGLPTP